MPMNRNNYREIASCINNARDVMQPRYTSTSVLIALLCGYLKENNPRFNAEKFKEACLNEQGE